MTLSTSTSRVNYPGAGSVGPFAIPFRFTSGTDLVVTKRSSTGGETTLTLATGFTVTGAGNATGTLTLTTALAVGETLSIRRGPALTQETSIRNQGSYFPATIEDEFDRLVMQMQDLRDRIDRSFALPESYDPAGYLLRLKGEAGKALVWQSATELGNSALDAGAIAIPGGGRTVATLSAYLLNNAVWNVKDFGALGDGATDDRAKIQAAIDAASAAGGGVVFFPKGVYIVADAMTLPSYVTLQGSARQKTELRYTKGTGTLFTLSGANDIGIRDMSMRASPNSSGAALSCSGVIYARDFLMENFQIEGFLVGLTFVASINCTIRHGRMLGQGKAVVGGIGIDLGATSGNSNTIDRVYINPYKIGVRLNNCNGVLLNGVVMELCETGAHLTNAFNICFVNPYWSETTVIVNNIGGSYFTIIEPVVFNDAVTRVTDIVTLMTGSLEEATIISRGQLLSKLRGRLVTQAQIVANQNNYVIPDSATTVRMTADAPRDITGITRGDAYSGRIIVLIVAGAQPITLKHQNAGSAVGNRFRCSTGADVAVAAGASKILVYDDSDNVWQVIA